MKLDKSLETPLSVNTNISNTDCNEFLSLIFPYFEQVYFGKYEEIKHHFFFKEKRNLQAEKIEEKILFKIDLLKVTSPSFDTLFDFATTIRSLEKSFFIENSADCSIAVNSSYGQNKNRELIINASNITIIIKLNRRITGDEIDIEVYNNFGKKLFNKFHIVDRDTKINEDEDWELLNSINYILQTIMSNYLYNIYKMIKDKQLFDKVLNRFNKKPDFDGIDL